MLKKFIWLILFGLTVMWSTSYTHYTSVGIDHDQVVNHQSNDQIEYSYYRLRWPGNGSIWFGGGHSYRPMQSSKPFEAFDLAATFLYPNPELPVVKSAYNKIGFWFINQSKPSSQIWLGIPAWLPILMFALILILSTKRTNDS